MWTTAVVMDREFFQRQPEVTLVDRNQIVHALTTKRSYEACAKCIRRGRPHGSFQNARTEAFQRLIQGQRKDRIAVVNHEPVGVVECKELAELLDGPLRGRMLGYVAMENPA